MCIAYTCPNCHMELSTDGSIQYCRYAVVLTKEQKQAADFKCPKGPITYLSDFNTTHEPNLQCSGKIQEAAFKRWRWQEKNTKVIREVAATSLNTDQNILINSYEFPGFLFHDYTRSVVKRLVQNSHIGMALQIACERGDRRTRQAYAIEPEPIAVTIAKKPAAAAVPHAGASEHLAGDDQETARRKTIVQQPLTNHGPVQAQSELGKGISGPRKAKKYEFFAYNGADDTESAI